MKALPADRIVQNHTVGSVLGRKAPALVLYAEHDKCLAARIADGAPPGRSYPHDRTFPDREDLAVDLEFTLAREKEVKFLVCFVGVQESGFRTGSERLEGELRTRC